MTAEAWSRESRDLLPFPSTKFQTISTTVVSHLLPHLRFRPLQPIRHCHSLTHLTKPQQTATPKLLACHLYTANLQEQYRKVYYSICTWLLLHSFPVFDSGPKLRSTFNPRTRHYLARRPITSTDPSASPLSHCLNLRCFYPSEEPSTLPKPSSLSLFPLRSSCFLLFASSACFVHPPHVSYCDRLPVAVLLSHRF